MSVINYYFRIYTLFTTFMPNVVLSYMYFDIWLWANIACCITLKSKYMYILGVEE